MRQNLIIILLLTIILAMAVPYSIYQSESEAAFTYDNLINTYPTGNNLNS